MDARISKSSPIYCDMGPFAGMSRIDIKGSVYLTGEELEKFLKTFDLVISIKE